MTSTASAMGETLRGAAETTQWFAPAWTMRPIAARRCLVHNPLNGASMELSSGEYAVLAACEGCRPLTEHEARAAARLAAPAAHRQAFRQLLERCAAQGLLVALPELVGRFGAMQRQPPAPLAGIVIRTADRPESLRRLLEGAAALQTRSGTAHRWHVLDDSRRNESRRGNREAIASCDALDLTHYDLWSDDPFEAALHQTFPEWEAEIRLLLGVPRAEEATYGRPINHALLRFAGRRVLLLDDDVTVDPRRAPLSRPGVEVSGGGQIAYRYESLDAGFRACPPVERDPFSEHVRWLGMPLAQAWAQAEQEPGGLRVGELPTEFAVAFAADARILFTRNHLLGDPGWDRFETPLLLLEPETRLWLAAEPDAARYAFASQVHWRGHSALQLTPHHTLSTTTLSGIDNSVLMPPVERFTRNADVLLGEAARCVYPSAWAVDLPFALPHLHAGGRRWLTPDEELVLSPSLILISHARSVRPLIRAQDASERMRALGACMLDLAAASDADLGRMLEEQALDYATYILFGINNQLEDNSLPAAWKNTLREWLASPLFKFDRASLRARLPSPQDVRGEALRFGKTLMVWPDLWGYCRERFAE